MARGRSRRGGEYGEFWPAYVDVLSTLLLVVTFLMSIFMISQYFATQEAAGKDTALQRLNPELKAGGSGLRRYPGSPWLLQDSVRPGDRVSLCELHPQDADTLKHNIGRDPAVSVHHRDGFEALKALDDQYDLPPGGTDGSSRANA